MINLVKTKLQELVVAETLKKVELSSAPEQEILDLFDPEFSPSVLLYYWDFEYSPSDQDMIVRQVVDKRIVALLHCPIDSLDDLEKAIVEKLLGLKKDEQHYGLEAVKSQAKDLGGAYIVRRIEFSTETKVREQLN